MLNQLIIGAVTATSLLMNTAPETSENQAPSTLMEPIPVSAQATEYTGTDGHYLRPVDATERLQYMIPANGESDEMKGRRREVKEELEERETVRAKEESKQKTEEARTKASEEWKANFPIIPGNSPQAWFLNEISKDAVTIGHEKGLYPSVMMAQAGLESNWGRSSLSAKHNNLMGMKGSYKGKSVNMRTWEDEGGGNTVYINAGFSAYDSWGDSLAHYGDLLVNGPGGRKSFYAGAWRKNAETYKDATSWLQGRYATDTKYASKLNNVIERYKLNRFDSVQPAKEYIENVKVSVEPEPVSLTVPEGYYEVQQGDSLFSIALTLDVPAENILEWNDLDSPLLQEKQWLTLEPVEKIITVEDLLSEKEDTQKVNEK